MNYDRYDTNSFVHVRPKRLPDWIKVTIALIVLVGLGMVVYSGIQNGSDENQIRNCVKVGGTPYYSTDRDGVVNFITCDQLEG